MSSQKIPSKAKLAYGAGEMGPAITGNILIFFLPIFFTSVAGLPASLAGIIYMISKAWDAINDPIIGWLSDRTKSRWGRRIPWMFWGAVPFAAICFSQWLVPNFSADHQTNQWMLFAYYVIVALLLQAVFTVVTLPYVALTAELTHDYDERTRLNSFRFAFSLSGSICALLLAHFIFKNIENEYTQYIVLGGTSSLLSLALLAWCIIGVRKLAAQREAERIAAIVSEEKIPFGRQLLIILENRPFLYVCAIYLCSWLAVQTTASILPYYVKDWMRLPSDQIPQVILAVQGTALLMLGFWSWLSQKVGKKEVYVMGMAFWIVAQIGLLFLEPGQVTLMYVLAVFAGFGVSVAYLIPWSMMPDVIELDELETGQRREGIFYAFMVLLQKLGLALGIFLVLQTLGYAGFIESTPGSPPPVQPEAALIAIRIAMGPIPGTALIIGLVFAWLYPITKEKHAEICRRLQQKKLLRPS